MEGRGERKGGRVDERKGGGRGREVGWERKGGGRGREAGWKSGREGGEEGR